MCIKKNILIILLCSLASACARPYPAPVRWGLDNFIPKSVHSVFKSEKNIPVKNNIIDKRNKDFIYVSRGNTAYSIAKDYGVSLDELIRINNLRFPYNLRSGQELILPKPNYYVVKKNDTLYSIAKKNQVPLTVLTEVNNIQSPYSISENQKIILPNKGVAKSNINNNKKSKLIDVTPPSSMPKRSSSKFLLPVQGKIISSFGSKKNGLHNDGVNISAKQGTPVKAADNGIVVYSSDKIKGLGNIILIKHDNNWVTTYGHLSKNFVTKNQKVDRGTTIGTVGKTGSVNSPQLHFEIRKDTKPVDPQKYITNK